jgi:hypothetical protein
MMASMSAVLRASGANFNVDRFCATSTLEPCTVYRAGEPVFPTIQPNGRRNQVSGIHIVVSDAEFDAFPQQVTEAISFLRTHHDQVRVLCEFPGVDGAILDFGIARRDVPVQCDILPPELIRLAGELGLGIELSQYPTGSQTCGEPSGSAGVA